jgi:hypothetical protein
VKSGSEHISCPIPYVRSFYYLGKIYEQQGELEKARKHYRPFFDYWKEGELDRPRVEEAARKMGA